MRIYFGLLVGILVLFGAAGECQADSLLKPLTDWWDTRSQLNDLKASFKVAPKVVVEKRGSEPYYDVAVENICGGRIEKLAHAWLDQGLANFLNRAIIIEASFTILDSKERTLDRMIFAAGNTRDSQSPCQNKVVEGVPSNEQVRVTLKFIIASELGPKSSLAMTGLLTAAAGLVTGPWGAVAVLTVGGIKPVLAAQAKDITQKALAAGGKLYYNSAVVGLPGQALATGNEQDWYYLHASPRQQLLDFHPGMDLSQIPELIDRVAVGTTWNEMLSDADIKHVAWLRPRAVDVFCGSFKGVLMGSLHQDLTAVRLGLYAVKYYGQFKGDRANRACLEPDDWNDLHNKGYIIFTFGS